MRCEAGKKVKRSPEGDLYVFSVSLVATKEVTGVKAAVGLTHQRLRQCQSLIVGAVNTLSLGVDASATVDKVVTIINVPDNGIVIFPRLAAQGKVIAKGTLRFRCAIWAWAE